LSDFRKKRTVETSKYRPLLSVLEKTTDCRNLKKNYTTMLETEGKLRTSRNYKKSTDRPAAIVRENWTMRN
jgi:hypothetical protein